MAIRLATSQQNYGMMEIVSMLAFNIFQLGQVEIYTTFKSKGKKLWYALPCAG